MARKLPVALIYRRLHDYEWEGQRYGWGTLWDILEKLYPNGFEVDVRNTPEVSRAERQYHRRRAT